MHPAPSLIFFTVFSGIGFALLALLTIVPPQGEFWSVSTQFGFGFAFAVAGLLASTLHLGNPQRALRAFTQWRTSWLSREGCLAVSVLFCSVIYASAVIFNFPHLPTIFLQYLGWFIAALCICTIFATSMIYTQLKTVPAWNTPRVPLMFLAYAFSGATILNGATLSAIYCLFVLAFLQVNYWLWVINAFERRGIKIGNATALGFLGQVRQFDPPHTGTNYLQREMIFSVARKHRKKIYRLGGVFVIFLPLLCLFWVQWGVLPLIIGHGLAIISHIIGAILVRWLFFAEAQHVVRLYYDQ